MKCSSMLVCVCVLFLSLGSSSGIPEDDVKCLKGIKESVNDPLGKLNSWDFKNTSVGNICKFVGVACWNDCENRIFNLKLQNMKLSGSVPQALEYCVSLQNLDLSGNHFSGTIPSQICTWLPFLVGLDLSNNDFSGSIPPELAKCTYLNSLILSDNRLSGNIPYQLTSLSRLRKFSVANNELRGAIPPLSVHLNAGTITNQLRGTIPSLHLNAGTITNQLRGTIPSLSVHLVDADFAGNRGLCGGPLGTKCGWLSKNNPAAIIFAALSGAAASLLLALGLWCWYLLRLSKRRKRAYEIRGGDDWSERLKAHKLPQVSLSVKPLVEVMLADLIASTNKFDPQNVIISTRHATIYTAALTNVSALAIKRLNTSKLGAKQFRMEMNRLGQLRHSNLTPLLGFCMVEDEKLLVYEHYSNGPLHSLLHGNGTTALDWPTRFRIGFGAVRGVTWLLHECQPPIIHQNVCSNVILIDEDFNARIMDFGLARVITSESNESSFVNGNLGELGYYTPVSTSTMFASLKDGAYGLGVVLLELEIGQKPFEVSTTEEGFKGNLVDWANHLSNSGRTKDVIDKAICERGHDEESLQFLRIACTCVVSRPKDRCHIYLVCQSLNGMAKNHGSSELDDNYPM